MASKTYTVTVASGQRYIVAGTGNGYFRAGLRGTTASDFTADWVAGATLRFELSDSSNDGHPLIFSSSNSAILGTFRAGVIHTGVTYYLDGVVGYADWLTPSSYDNATVRYIEIAPASSPINFYWGCYIHGIGMGGPFDLQTDVFAAGMWGHGGWGDQDDSVVTLTQLAALTLSINDVTAKSSSGWGRGDWGEQNWGQPDEATALSGQELSSAIATVTIDGEINTGWSRATWGADAWGIEGDILATGQSVTLSLATVSVTAEVKSGWGRGEWGNQVWGDADEAAAPTGESLTISQASVTIDADVNQGWGRLTWGANAWGLFGTLQLTGQELATSIASVSISAEVNKGWGRSTWGSDVWGDAEITVADVSGLSLLSLSQGNTTVVITDVHVTALPSGVNATTVVASVTADAEVNTGWGRLTWGEGGWGGGLITSVTGVSATLALGNESTLSNAKVTLTGLALSEIVAAVVVAGSSVDPAVTGVSLTTATGTFTASIWTEINPNVSMVWTELAA